MRTLGIAVIAILSVCGQIASSAIMAAGAKTEPRRLADRIDAIIAAKSADGSPLCPLCCEVG